MTSMCRLLIHRLEVFVYFQTSLLAQIQVREQARNHNASEARDLNHCIRSFIGVLLLRRTLGSAFAMLRVAFEEWQ